MNKNAQQHFSPDEIQAALKADPKRFKELCSVP